MTWGKMHLELAVWVCRKQRLSQASSCTYQLSFTGHP